MNRHRLVNAGHLSFVAAVVVAVLTTGLTSPAHAASGDGRGHRVEIAPIDSQPFGQSYAEWAVDWWNWALETPVPDNVFSGGPCKSGQTGRVWFLAGVLSPGVAERSCTVPANRAIFFPLWANFYGAFLNDPPDQRTAKFVLKQPSCTADHISVKIDDAEVKNPKRYYVGSRESGLFNIQLPKANIFGLTDEQASQLKLSPSAQSGYFLFLPSLRPGEHKLHWTASGICFGGPQTQDVTYSLAVQRH